MTSCNPRYVLWLKAIGQADRETRCCPRDMNDIPWEQRYSPWINARWKEWYAHINADESNRPFCVIWPVDDPRSIRRDGMSGQEMFDAWLPMRVAEMEAENVRNVQA